jgi:hypothetical protein
LARRLHDHCQHADRAQPIHRVAGMDRAALWACVRMSHAIRPRLQRSARGRRHVGFIVCHPVQKKSAG